MTDLPPNAPGPPWTPNPGGQADFVHDWSHRVVALQGGWGGGKTWAGARKLLTAHALNAFDAQGQPTAATSAVGAPTYRSARDFDIPELEAALREVGLGFTWRDKDSCFLLPDLATHDRPSRILVRTADRPELITGWQAAVLWLDEPTRFRENPADPRRDPLTQFLGRLRWPGARLVQLIMTYTNETDATAVHAMMHRGLPDHALHTAPTRQNPHVAEFHDAMRRQLPPELADQYLDGRAVRLAGRRVYDAFDPGRHIDPGLAYQPARPLHLALDFNIRPGMHGLLGQHDPARDQLTVFDEIHAPGLDVRGLATRLAQRLAALPETPAAVEIFGDATGANRWAGTGQSCYDVLRHQLDRLRVRHRLRVPKANPPVVDRRHAFNFALADLDGEPHWICHPRCRQLIADLQSMQHPATGRPADRDPDRSHASDAEGYRIHQLRPLRPPPRRAATDRLAF